jgi:hypothetical protein
MKKEDLLKSLEDFQKGWNRPYLSGYVHESWKNEPNLKDKDFKGFCSEEWAVSGRTGGTPWNDDELVPLEAEDPKEIVILDEFLEKYFPSITILQYKRLSRLIKFQNWSDDQYYGNNANYKCAYITFEDIASCLEPMMDSQ